MLRTSLAYTRSSNSLLTPSKILLSAAPVRSGINSNKGMYLEQGEENEEAKNWIDKIIIVVFVVTVRSCSCPYIPHQARTFHAMLRHKNKQITEKNHVISFRHIINIEKDRGTGVKDVEKFECVNPWEMFMRITHLVQEPKIFQCEPISITVEKVL